MAASVFSFLFVFPPKAMTRDQSEMGILCVSQESNGTRNFLATFVAYPFGGYIPQTGLIRTLVGMEEAPVLLMVESLSPRTRQGEAASVEEGGGVGQREGGRIERKLDVGRSSSHLPQG